MSTAVAEARKAQAQDVHAYLKQMLPQFQLVLPKSIPAERYVRIVLTAVNNNPTLLECDRRSLLSACMKLATDGYIPDGVRAALVPFKNKSGAKIVTPIKMIQGMREKARESGEVSDWRCEVVHANDQFDYSQGDEPFILHKPKLTERGEIIAAYSIVTMKDGTKTREVMSREDLDKARAKSRAAEGAAWAEWPGEMYRKTVGRRHFKQIPSSNVLETFFRDDDDEPDAPDTRPRPKAITGAIDVDDVPGSDAAADQDDTADGPGEAAGGFADRVNQHARILAAAAQEGPLALSSAWSRVPDDFKGALHDTYEDLTTRHAT